MDKSDAALAEAIRRTIQRLEKADPNDPKMAELKRHALLRLAELQEPATHRRGKKVLVVRPPSDPQSPESE